MARLVTALSSSIALARGVKRLKESCAIVEITRRPPQIPSPSRPVHLARRCNRGRIKKRDRRATNVIGESTRRDGGKKNRDSLTPRRYGAGRVSELLRAHGKKLDDEQVGRGLNEVCAGCKPPTVGMETYERERERQRGREVRARSTRQVD